MNNQSILQKATPYVAAVLIFLAVAFFYCSPVFEGKVIQQGDVIQAMGMQHELTQYHEQTGKYTLWTNSMFGGMPAYQIGRAGVPESNIFSLFAKILRFDLPAYSVDIIFLYLICFFILMLAFGIDPWLSIAGAIAFAFSSYNFVIILAGHVNQAFVIGLMPAVLAGFVLVYKGKYLLGAIVSILSFGVHLYFNHPQMTYYLAVTLLVYLIVELTYSIREKTIRKFLISTSIIGGSYVLALIPNVTGLITTYEYSKDTTRGKSELNVSKPSKSSGLDKDYALAWSYDKMETFTLMIPNFKGGASGTELSDNSDTYKRLIGNGIPASSAKDFVRQAPTYWGDQQFTLGPVYFGAVICFLFVLGIYLLDKKYRWWMLIACSIAILLSWGRHFMLFTDLFFYYFPLYSKFRTVSSILVVPSIIFPLVAILGINKIIKGEVVRKDLIKYTKYSLYIVGGIALFFLILGGSIFSFTGESDSQLNRAGYPQWLISGIINDRITMQRLDAFRSLVFIIIAAAIVFLYINGKLKLKYFIICLISIILIDMWPVDKRYLNNDEFIPKKRFNTIQPTQVDLQIMQDKDPDYRVLNLTVNPFTDARTSYFHKSIGGYHGAKLRRYQELIDAQLSNQNMSVLDMLNTKYIIVRGEKGEPVVRKNPSAMGNAWFVNAIGVVKSADEELYALGDFQPKEIAVMNNIYLSKLPDINTLKAGKDTTDKIYLVNYQPNDLKYRSSASKDRFAVFSEIYYNDHKGWNAYLDGKKVTHVCVDYVLRGMYVPAGNHDIEFKFEPASFYLGLKISYISSGIVAVALIVLLGLAFFKKSKPLVSD